MAANRYTVKDKMNDFLRDRAALNRPFHPEALGFMFRALRSRNYRLFFSGQLISLIGTWLAQIAMSWMVYQMTGSKVLLGVVAFVGQIPAFILSPVAGVLIDRWALRKTLVMTQTLAMVQALALAVLTLTDLINIVDLLLLSMFLGLVNAFDMPARQAFVVQMIDRREDLSNAIALNSSMFNMARLLGPTIAGVMIAMVGEGICFLVNGLSYGAVIAALLAMKVAPHSRPPVRQVLHEFREGLKYLHESMSIRAILLLMGLVSLMGVPYMVLMPVFAQDVLQGGPHTLGFLTGATGVGALIGGLLLASRQSVLGLGQWLVRASAGFGVCLTVFGFSRSLWLSLAVLPAAGFTMIVQMASSNTLLQTIVEDSKRGRMMAFYSMAFQGTMPIGSLMAGGLAETALGAPGVVAIGGVCCIIGSLLFRRKLPIMRQQLRPLYVERGILPEMADGLGAATQTAVPPDQH